MPRSLTTLLLAGAAMALSSVSVITNALLLGRFKPTRPAAQPGLLRLSTSSPAHSASSCGKFQRPGGSRSTMRSSAS